MARYEVLSPFRFRGVKRHEGEIIDLSESKLEKLTQEGLRDKVCQEGRVEPDTTRPEPPPVTEPEPAQEPVPVPSEPAAPDSAADIPGADSVPQPDVDPVLPEALPTELT